MDTAVGIAVGVDTGAGIAGASLGVAEVAVGVGITAVASGCGACSTTVCSCSQAARRSAAITASTTHTARVKCAPSISLCTVSIRALLSTLDMTSLYPHSTHRLLYDVLAQPRNRFARIVDEPTQRTFRRFGVSVSILNRPALRGHSRLHGACYTVLAI